MKSKRDRASAPDSKEGKETEKSKNAGLRIHRVFGEKQGGEDTQLCTTGRKCTGLIFDRLEVEKRDGKDCCFGRAPKSRGKDS